VFAGMFLRGLPSLVHSGL